MVSGSQSIPSDELGRFLTACWMCTHEKTLQHRVIVCQPFFCPRVDLFLCLKSIVSFFFIWFFFLDLKLFDYVSFFIEIILHFFHNLNTVKKGEGEKKS